MLNFKGNSAIEGEVRHAAPAAKPFVDEEPVQALRRVGFAASQCRILKIPLKEITKSHLPCLAMMTGGRAVVLLALRPDGLFDLQQENGVSAVSADQIAPYFGGSIITQYADDASAEKSEDRLHIDLLSIMKATLKAPKLFEIILVAIMSNIFMFALPMFSMAVYDRIIPHKAYETLWSLTIGIMLVFTLDFVGRVLRNGVQEQMAYRIGSQMQMRMFSRILSTDMEHAPKSASGISSAMQAVDGACHLMPPLLIGLMVDLPFMLVLFIYVGVTAHWVVLSPLVSVLILLAANAYLHYSARKAHEQSAKQAIARNTLIEESVNAFGVTKVTASQGPTLRALAELTAATHKSSAAARSANSTAALVSNTVIQLNTVLVLVVGIFIINSGGMTVGTLVSAVMLSARGISPIIALVGSVVRAFSLAEPLRIADKMISLPAEEAGDANRTVANLKGQVDLSGVTFRYAQSVAPALKELNLSFKAGERVGIIGSIGSGKSTLIKLIPRLHCPTAGGVLIDGHDVRQYDPDFLRRQIAYMPQDCDLYDTTIRDNIIKGLGVVDEAAFDEAVRISGVRDIVTRHPAGYDLQVGKYGRRLSGGERQAVCLARALTRNAPILIMDEPTSAMDSQMEKAVIDRLSGALAGKTLIVATHRAPLLSLVERVIWLDGGKVIADGPPAEVIARASKAA